MVQFNFSERTIKAKVVYYGPAQSGKTTNLEQIHRLTDPAGANRLISLNTAQDRTLFFDLLPFSLGTVSGYDFKIQLYTVPGQVQYNATRRVVLAGADAVVFVADSNRPMAKENQAAFENMKVNLLANRLVPEKVPLVFQYNKQDLASLVPREELDHALNPWRRKAFPAVAARGEGAREADARRCGHVGAGGARRAHVRGRRARGGGRLPRRGCAPRSRRAIVQHCCRRRTGPALAGRGRSARVRGRRWRPCPACSGRASKRWRAWEQLLQRDPVPEAVFVGQASSLSTGPDSFQPAPLWYSRPWLVRCA